MMEQFHSVPNFMLCFGQPLAGLKRLASFGARGGGVLVRDFSRLVQTWCRGGSGLFFGHRLAGAQKPKTGVGNPFFRVQNSFFGGRHGAEISFFGVKISFFGAQKC